VSGLAVGDIGQAASASAAVATKLAASNATTEAIERRFVMAERFLLALRVPTTRSVA
jgi:hypothetical protein